MFKNVSLSRFKNHYETQLNFDGSRLHAVVGQNGAGKTSILQAIHTLCKLSDPDDPNIVVASDVFQNELAPSSLATSRLVGKEREILVSASGIRGDATWVAWYQWRYDITNIKGHSQHYWQIHQGWRVNKEDMSHAELNIAPFPISDELRYAAYLKLNARNLAKPGYSDHIAPTIRQDGTGLAPLMDYIRAESLSNFHDIEQMLRKIVPNIRKIHIKRAVVPATRYRTIEADKRVFTYEANEERMGQKVLFDMNKSELIPASSMGEGTVLLLGLLAVLLSPNRPNLILLDDIEQGLHPKAQVELVMVLKEIINLNPELQVIFTTHSPYILDELKPSQVHVLHLDEDGYTVAKRMDENKSSSWAFDELTTGEFWDAEGEEWVLEEREKEVVVDG